MTGNLLPDFDTVEKWGHRFGAGLAILSAITFALSILWAMVALVMCGWGAGYGWGPATTFMYQSWGFIVALMVVSAVAVFFGFGIMEMTD